MGKINNKIIPVITETSQIIREPSRLPDWRDVKSIFPCWITAPIILEQIIGLTYDIPELANFVWVIDGITPQGTVLRKEYLAPGQVHLHFGDSDFWLLVNAIPPEDKVIAQKTIEAAAKEVFRIDEVYEQILYEPQDDRTERKAQYLMTKNAHVL